MKRSVVANGGRFAAVMVVALLLSACGSRVTVPKLSEEETSSFKAAGNFPDREYRIQTGDRIDIKFPFHTEMDEEALVRPDGKISIKEIGEVAVDGKTTTEIEDMLKESHSKRLKEPDVRVTIAKFAPQSVYVTGEVGQPGLIPYRKGLTPLQAIIQAGGFRDTAVIDGVILVRASSTDDKFISRSLDLEPVVEEGVPEQVLLAPRDVVYVPKTRIAEANVWVDQHITKLFPFIRGAGARFPLGF